MDQDKKKVDAHKEEKMGWYNPVTWMFVVIVVSGLGKLLAWYWCQITGHSLTDDLVYFSITLTTFFVVDGLAGMVIEKYINKRVDALSDEKEKKRLRLKLGWIHVLFCATVAFLGYLGLLLAPLL